ncbi:ephexin [Arctopsyche grandis]|uniref:ephexin n=1 Tax=Arctopsyche grandis TaxID=121162 RepID=UPI00406D78E9
MRNDTTEPHQKPLDTNFKNLIKNNVKVQGAQLPDKALQKGKTKVLSSEKADLKVNKNISNNPTLKFRPTPLKNSDLTNELKKKLENTSTHVELRKKSINDINICRNSVNKAKQQFDNFECPELNKKHILELNKLLKGDKNVKKCNDDDSRIKGGGVSQISSITNKIRLNCHLPTQPNNLAKLNSLKPQSPKQCSDSVKIINNVYSQSTRQIKDSMTSNLKDSNTTHKVSFKTKNFSRKPAYSKISTTSNSTKVATLTHKFNEIIKENDSRDTKTTVILGSKNKSESVNLKLGKNNTVIISKIGHHKKLFSINAIDGVNVKRSPLVRRKLVRVKSDSAVKRKNLPKKRINNLGSSFNHSHIIDDQSSHSTDAKTFNKPKQKITISQHSNIVRTTIQKFESEKTEETPKMKSDTSEANKTDKIVKLNINIKPKIPEKKVNVYITKNVVIRDGKPKIKLIKKTTIDNKNAQELNENESEPFDTTNRSFNDKEILNEYLKTINEDEIITEKSLQRQETSMNSYTCIENTNNNIIHLRISQKKDNDMSSQEEKYEDRCDEEYQYITDAPRPNDSFLWRNSKSEFMPYSDVKKEFHNSVPYACVTPIVSATETEISSTAITIDDICPPFEAYLDKADKLLQIKKREIANEIKKDKMNQTPVNEAINITLKPLQEKILEAINSLVEPDKTNIRDEMNFSNSYEDYETFETVSDDINSSKDIPSSQTSISSQSHIKMNCPLPELPMENTDNVYQCLYDFNFDDNDYEYCHQKIDSKRSPSDSEDAYDYCTTPEPKLPPANVSNDIVPVLPERKYIEVTKDFSISKSNSIASSVGYEKISSIYEKSLILPQKSHLESSKSDASKGSILNYDSCSEENIYDVIKTTDSNCYESISEGAQSPIKLRQKQNNKNLAQIIAEKQIPFDSISILSQSCSGSIMSSDQKTNSIYEQRSITSFDRSTIVSYGKAPSEISSSDRSDDWEDMSDQENTTIVINVQEITRGKHSPTSWSRKVRHHWNKSSKNEDDSNDMDNSSDNEHLYESLSFGALPDTKDEPYDDSDSFDSGSEHSFDQVPENDDPNIKNPRLPDPPVSTSTYTLTHFAKKMKQFTTNFTKSTRKKSNINSPKIQSPTLEINQPRFMSPQGSLDKSNGSLSPISPLYENVVYPNSEVPSRPVSTSSDKSPQNLTNKSKSNNVTTNDVEEKSSTEKDQNSKKIYLSLKSKFRRPVSIIYGSNSTTLKKKTNSTFYVPKLPDEVEDDKKYEKTPPIKKSDDGISQKNKAATESEVNCNTNGKKHSPLNLLRVSIPKIGNIRPNAPPPPPPQTITYDKSPDSKKDEIIRRSSACSYYNRKSLEQRSEENRISRGIASWYDETGLYQSSNISTSSGTSSTMSGSGTCSTSAAFSSPSTPIPPIGMFNHEPLYQFYDAAKVELACRDIDENFNLDSEIYEEIDNDKEKYLPQRPPAMTLVNPKNGPSRTLWCEVPEVINSSILSSMSDRTRKVQEAKFEIITSEASYLNSLTVLESQFINHPAFRDEMIISKNDRHTLFGNISPVKKCSERLMSEFESCWQDNILLRGLCKILKNHAEKYFHVYVTFCEYQNRLPKTLKKLKSQKQFITLYEQFQTQPMCHNLSLDSFLLLPMQRITRLPLLLDAVLKHLSTDDDEYQPYVETLNILNGVVNQCNEGNRNIERIDEMKTISCQIEFPQNIKEIQLIESQEQNKQNSKPCRWLVKSGDLTHLSWRAEDQSKLTFGRKIQKSTIYLFLFTDLLVITKKKGNEEKYTVIDYCKRSLVEMTRGDTVNQNPLKESAGKYVVLLTLLENFDSKIVEMLLSCESESVRERWLEAFSKPTHDNPNETIYEGWDCPQVTALYNYQSIQQDELSLQPGDIINVNKKIIDGWYHGERLRDGETGWFPGNYTHEIASAHVRARNLKLKYRLLDLSGNYLNQQKKKGIQY